MGEGDGDKVMTGDGDGRMGFNVGTSGLGEAPLAGSGAVASLVGVGKGEARMGLDVGTSGLGVAPLAGSGAVASPGGVGEGEARLGLDVGTLGLGEELTAGSGALAPPGGDGRGPPSGAAASGAGCAKGDRRAVGVGPTDGNDGRDGDVPAGLTKGAASAGTAVGT